MDFNTYQHEAKRTLDLNRNQSELIQMSALGLNGEAGEVADLIKKHYYHGHELDIEAVQKELGDVLWYIATCATVFNINLEDIAKKNVEKLQKRYPNGFNTKDSLKRIDT